MTQRVHDVALPVASEEDDHGRTDARRRQRRNARLAAFGFIAPVVVYIALFFLYPIIRTGELSVQDYRFQSYVTGEAPCIGLRNYAWLFSSPLFPKVIWHTFLFVGVSLLFQFVIGLALAVFFSRRFPLSGLFRALILIPVFEDGQQSMEELLKESGAAAETYQRGQELTATVMC